MYAHKYIAPRSTFIKYRGNTGQIDRKDTIIAILAANPGLYGAQIADKIFDKNLFPVSYGKVYEVLSQLCSEGSIIRNGRFYYLMSDAVTHDMAVTANTVEKLGEIGVDLTTARFLSSGIIMAGEAYAAEQRGENFNIDETAAAGVASAPEVKPYLSDEEIDAQIEDNVADIELPESLTIDNPFTSIGDSERQSLKEEADRLIAESYAQEKADEEAKLLAAKQAKEKSFMSSITSVNDLEGKTVEICPGKYKGQVVGTILEVRKTGMTFLVTFSQDETISFGTVMPMEYADGLTYKILVDFDED